MQVQNRCSRCINTPSYSPTHLSILLKSSNKAIVLRILSMSINLILNPPHQSLSFELFSMCTVCFTTASSLQQHKFNSLHAVQNLPYAQFKIYQQLRTVNFNLLNRKKLRVSNHTTLRNSCIQFCLQDTLLIMLQLQGYQQHSPAFCAILLLDCIFLHSILVLGDINF